MFDTDDSIVAIATPPGRGGLGIVRISGSRAAEIAGALLDLDAPLQPRHATYTMTRAARTLAVCDEVVATYFAAPHSYTGEHVVEISAHGSPVVLRAIVQRALDAGARLAEPGEFTLRAFLNGKRDLVQAEAVGDLIAAATPLQARVAFDQLDGTLTRRIREIDAELFELIARLEASLDFPDEGYHFIEPAETASRIGALVERIDILLGDARRGRMIREGATAVIAGRPNVGKSSMFNRLAGSERAIVTEIPGTTRDLITEQVDVEGIAVTVVDTAGWRDTVDIVEREGVARATRARDVAHVVLLVLDQSEPLTEDDERLLEQTAKHPRIIVASKGDLPAATGRLTPAPTSAIVGAGFSPLVTVSAKTGEGFDNLRRAIADALTGGEPLRDTAAISNQRHIALLEEARAHLTSARQAAATGATPEEFVLTDLQAARACFDDIVGTRTSEDVLRHIFERFCIGK
jgi:tRNA modification GTPase